MSPRKCLSMYKFDGERLACETAVRVTEGGTGETLFVTKSKSISEISTSEIRRPWGALYSRILVLRYYTTIQVVYLTFKRLWNLARETFAPVWSLSKLFIPKNLIIKSLKKIWSGNIQKRRPRGSSIKHDEIWPAKFGQMCLPQIFQVYLLHLSEF